MREIEEGERQKIRKVEAGSRYLIPTKRIEIHPQLPHIQPPMRRQRHTIHTQQRPAHLMHLRRYRAHIMDRAQHITRVRTRHEDRFGRHQGPQVLGREAQIRGGGGGGGPPFQNQILGGAHAHPGGDVGFVVEGREDDFGTWGEREGEGEVGEELGCGGTDYWGGDWGC